MAIQSAKALGRPIGAGSRAGRWPHYGYIILPLSLAVITAALGLGRWAYPPILPSMRAGLGLNYTQAGMISTAEMIGYTAFGLVGGILASRVGPRKVIAAGLLLVGASLLLAGLTPGFEGALLARLLTGVGAAGANIATLGLAGRWCARSRRGLATGVCIAGSPLGVLVAGQSVPRIIAAGGDDGWRQSWLYLGFAVLAVAVIAALLLRNHPREKGLRPLWASEAQEAAEGAGAGGGQATLRSVLHNSGVRRVVLIYAMHGFAYIAYCTFFVSHLLGRGFTPLQAGDLWGLVGFFAVAGAIIWGIIADRVGHRRAMVVTYAVEGVGIALLALGDGLAEFTLSVALFGVGASGAGTMINTTIGDYVDDKALPAALGFAALFYGTGMAIAPTLEGAIADAVGSFVPAMLLGSLATLLGAAMALRLRRAPGSLP